MKLVVGLGNPGEKYKGTRHNIGAAMLEEFLDWEKLGELKYNNKWKSEILVSDDFGERIIFCVPQTYMNLSGEAVGPLSKFYKIKPEDILIIHDEIDFIVGRVAFKTGGSAAGHNGLKNIIEKLGTKDFNRIRIGVGRPATSSMVTDYVLSKFKPNEKDLISEVEDQVFDLISRFIKGEGFKRFLN